jgi:hypothetical protein
MKKEKPSKTASKPATPRNATKAHDERKFSVAQMEDLFGRLLQTIESHQLRSETLHSLLLSHFPSSRSNSRFREFEIENLAYVFLHRVFNRARDNDRIRELPTDWKHLVYHADSWRMQLYVKGRNLTASQVVRTMTANEMTRDQVAEDLAIPIEAVNESVEYVKANQELINFEAAFERLALIRKGYSDASKAVS